LDDNNTGGNQLGQDDQEQRHRSGGSFLRRGGKSNKSKDQTRRHSDSPNPFDAALRSTVKAAAERRQRELEAAALEVDRYPPYTIQPTNNDSIKATNKKKNKEKGGKEKKRIKRMQSVAAFFTGWFTGNRRTSLGELRAPEEEKTGSMEENNKTAGATSNLKSATGEVGGGGGENTDTSGLKDRIEGGQPVMNEEGVQEGELATIPKKRHGSNSSADSTASSLKSPISSTKSSFTTENRAAQQREIVPGYSTLPSYSGQNLRMEAAHHGGDRGERGLDTQPGTAHVSIDNKYQKKKEHQEEESNNMGMVEDAPSWFRDVDGTNNRSKGKGVDRSVARDAPKWTQEEMEYRAFRASQPLKCWQQDMEKQSQNTAKGYEDVEASYERREPRSSMLLPLRPHIHGGDGVQGRSRRQMPLFLDPKEERNWRARQQEPERRRYNNQQRSTNPFIGSGRAIHDRRTHGALNPRQHRLQLEHQGPRSTLPQHMRQQRHPGRMARDGGYYDNLSEARHSARFEESEDDKSFSGGVTRNSSSSGFSSRSGSIHRHHGDNSGYGNSFAKRTNTVQLEYDGYDNGRFTNQHTGRSVTPDHSNLMGPPSLPANQTYRSGTAITTARRVTYNDIMSSAAREQTRLSVESAEDGGSKGGVSKSKSVPHFSLPTFRRTSRDGGTRDDGEENQRQGSSGGGDNSEGQNNTSLTTTLLGAAKRKWTDVLGSSSNETPTNK